MTQVTSVHGPRFLCSIRFVEELNTLDSRAHWIRIRVLELHLLAGHIQFDLAPGNAESELKLHLECCSIKKTSNYFINLAGD